MQKYCCDEKTSKRLLKDLWTPSAARAWTLLNQYIVDLLFKKYKRKFTGVNTLEDSKAPCCPGAVILVKERNFIQWFLRKDKPAVIAAQLPDFYEERTLCALRDVGCLRQKQGQPFILGTCSFKFKTEELEKEVWVEMTNLELNSIEPINSNVVRVDLDNFADTGFHSDYFYIVKHTLTAERIRILVNVSGETDMFDERVSRAIAFTADKVKLGYGGTILKTKPIRSRLPISLLSKTNYDLLINNLLPNQTRFGGAVGDFCDPDDEHMPFSGLRRLQRHRQMDIMEEDWQLVFGRLHSVDSQGSL